MTKQLPSMLTVLSSIPSPGEGSAEPKQIFFFTNNIKTLRKRLKKLGYNLMMEHWLRTVKPQVLCPMLHMNIHTQAHTHTHRHIYTHEHTYTYTYKTQRKHIYKHTYACVYTLTHKHICMHTYTNTYTIYTQAHINTHTTYTQAYIHTIHTCACTQTHTQIR